ncbi:hypothetical protein [Planococcus maritimus]|uniref:hypothetical protein n=1 Tax=Planococcus maritimus TaxID=192421 RepID=UPI00232C0734|nr:hypothetical protein [Planococcus maritimus]
MGKYLEELNEIEYITLDELFERSEEAEDDEVPFDVVEFDENYCEVTIDFVEEQYYQLVRTEQEINWESFLSVSDLSVVDENKVQNLLENLNPALLMTIPKIIITSNKNEAIEEEKFAANKDQWEEDSEDTLYDFFDQFIIINAEEYQQIAANESELNLSIVKQLLAEIIDSFYSNPLYSDVSDLENKDDEKEELLKGLLIELNLDVLK